MNRITAVPSNRPMRHVYHHDPHAASQELAEADHRRRERQRSVGQRNVRIFAIGRLLVAGLFLVSGAVKAGRFTATSQALSELGFRDAGVLLSVAILIELACGAFLAVGLWTRSTAGLLAGYLATVTLVVFGGLASDAHRAWALANLAFIGALLMLVAHGAGAWSADRWLSRRSHRQHDQA
jgi:putative oxidoreductase